MKNINYSDVEFLISAASKKDFILDSRPQIVFAGRSNVGKSSVINRLLGRKSVARVSAQPGKTAQVNYFQIGGELLFVDLPGYGYAKVAHTERERWGGLISNFFATPAAKTLGIMIIDIRHPPSKLDIMMAELYRNIECPMLVIANKSDKIKKTQAISACAAAKEALSLSDEVEVLPFSANDGTGRDEILRRINEFAGEDLN